MSQSNTSSTQKTILIANRGEIAARIIRTLAEMGWRSVAIYADDDQRALHTLQADVAVPLNGSGPAAYLDIPHIIEIAKQQGCDGLHPGYGFLSENPLLAQACEDNGIVFIGPSVETLNLFGDKAEARSLAKRCGVPVLEGIDRQVNPQQALSFFESLPSGSSVVIKAIAGGGGRGMRVVHAAEEVVAAYERCQSEAATAFGDGSLYVEQWASNARHVEVQVLGDGQQCVHLFERECTLQRRHQKVLEVAPSPSLSLALKQALYEAALIMARKTRYVGLGTFEFLVFERDGEMSFVFIEANPRIQVEHTVTETVLGLDLVQLQLQLQPQLKTGVQISQLGLESLAYPVGFAVQCRINMETLLADGTVKPSGGEIKTLDTPGGNGVRVDSYVYSGYRTSARYDSMIAKLIVHAPRADFASALRKTLQALKEFRVMGIDTNIPVLKALLSNHEVQQNRIHTRFIDQHLEQLLDYPNVELLPQNQNETEANNLTHVASENSVTAPMQGTVISVEIESGAEVKVGQALLIMDAMKMEHVIAAPSNGYIETVHCVQGEGVNEGQPLLEFIPTETESSSEQGSQRQNLDHIRADLQEVYDRHAYGIDENRPDAVAKRRATGQRTARENIADLCDENSFVEYGSLVIAAQRRRRKLQDLMEKTPGDGMVTGLATVNGALFGEQTSQCVVMSYDYTVMAGTQGIQNHHKKDRMFELAEQLQVPVVLFSEGGGGRPGDTDGLGSSASLDCLAFLYFAQLSGLVPLVGIASGRNFAGNAALLGCCDVVIATKNANIGMGGPAMIEGGGLGVYRPEEVGPTSIQASNGVIDVLVEDEAQAVVTAKQYLSYFQGKLCDWQVPDQRALRSLIPENRLRVYDVRTVIETMMDVGSVLELRNGFGKGMITAFARVEGRSVGVIANNPQYLSGAINSDGADKAARFMQLCDAFDIPLLFLCDTPGIMVGPEVEKTALVKHAARMFVTAASLSIPFFTIVLRKAYGLGAMTMAGGSLKAPVFTVSWPTGEFGAMGLEGAVKLGFRKELEAERDPEKQKARFDEMVADMYERGKAVNNATFFEFDDVIDPAESRKWILTGMNASSQGIQGARRDGKKRPCVDTW